MMFTFLLWWLTVVFTSMLLDFIVGDPKCLPHSVKAMGVLISIEEKIVRTVFRSCRGLQFGGFLLASFSCLISFFVTLGVLKLFSFSFFMHFALEVLISATCIAARSLYYETKKTIDAVEKNLDAGRKQLSNIVGRDTENLSKEEVVKACIETLAENISDGVIAPLFYIFIFGPLGAVCYKQINTLDSMIGYTNE